MQFINQKNNSLSENINSDNLKIKLATFEDLNNLDFDCGDDDLNEFILEDYEGNLFENLCVIYLCLYNNEVVGFFSLSADSINSHDDANFKITYSMYPAIKLEG